MVFQRATRHLVVALFALACQPARVGTSTLLADSATAKPDAAAADISSADAGGTEAGADATLAGADGATASPDPVAMVAFPAGTYYRGASAKQVTAGLSMEDELPQHQVQISAFALDQQEVTAARYGACVQAGKCTPATSAATKASCNTDAPGQGNHPINCVNWLQAEAYCAWAGKRLPTDAEWEYAARGMDSGPEPRWYPWGNEAPDCTRAVMKDASGDGCGLKATWPVCSKPAGNSPQGLCDLAGNVWEFTSDWFYAYGSGIQTDPIGPKAGTIKVIRGGSSAAPAEGMRASLRGTLDPTKAFSDIGFRCAK